VSYNITDINKAPVHLVFDETVKSAEKRGIRVTGSEIIGLVPKKVLLDAADYFLYKQQRSLGIPEKEKIKIAVKSLGLDDLKPFDPEEKIIEYQLEKDSRKKRLIDMSLGDFADLTASENPAPGGGSVSAYIGSLGAALGTMVANLSSHKRGWDERWEFFSEWAVKGEKLKQKLAVLTDKDTDAFNKIMEAFRMPKKTEEEKKLRLQAIEDATVYAMEIPLEVMQTAYEAMEINETMIYEGLQSSLSDAMVGILALAAAVEGAFFNVLINAKDLKNREKANQLIEHGKNILKKAREKENLLRQAVLEKLS
jgi:glutamate formiminotransferase/formiminotetrahydrofolate cyclodeaminase